MSNNTHTFDRGYGQCIRTSATSAFVMPSHAVFGTRGANVQADLGAEKPATGKGPRTWSPPI